MKPDKMAFEIRYGDDSGVEFAVRYDKEKIDEEIEIEHIDKISIPASRLGWFRDVLYEISHIHKEHGKEAP